MYVIDKSNIRNMKEFQHQFISYYLLSNDLLSVPSSIQQFLIDRNEKEMDFVMGCQVRLEERVNK